MYVNRMTYGTRRRIGGPPALLSDGNTPKWFVHLVNITKDGSDFVSIWDNKSGINGIIPGALLQASGSAQPECKVDGVEFDGFEEFMKCVAFTLIQPTMIYIVFKQVTWTSSDSILDGNTASSGLLYQTGTSPEMIAGAGGFSPPQDNLPLDTFGIVRVLFNGVSSKIIVNETTPITGNFGANNMSGFTLGARGSDSHYSNILVPEVFIRKIVDTAPNEQIIYNYLADKYSIS